MQITRRADSLYSDIWMPDETVRIRKEARAFADDVLRPMAYALNTTAERRDGFPRAAFEAIGAAGLYTIPFSADVGGRGLEFPTLATMTVAVSMISPMILRLFSRSESPDSVMSAMASPR